MLCRLVTGCKWVILCDCANHSQPKFKPFGLVFHMVSICFQIISLPIALVVKKRREKSAEIHRVAENEEHLRSLGACVPAMFLPSEFPQKHTGSLSTVNIQKTCLEALQRTRACPCTKIETRAGSFSSNTVPRQPAAALTNYEHPSQVPLK